MTFRLPHALATLGLFAIETAIALFVHDSFVRPHVGDILAVVLVYLALRAVTRLPRLGAVLAAFAVACAVEIGQAFDLVDRLGLGGSALARCVFGTGFDPWDFLAYLAGAGIACFCDPRRSAVRQPSERGKVATPQFTSRHGWR